MLNKAAFTLVIICLANSLFAQDVKKEADAVKTKMDVFASKTGTITKFSDTKLAVLKTTYDNAETRVRKVSSGNISGYFYQIVKPGKYGSTTASIEYSDLVEVLKAFKILKAEVEKDVAASPDYLENKFVTVDGFQVGYFVSKAKVSWYLRLEKYGSDNTLFFDNAETVENSFTEGKNKIDELRK
ncbi:MAG: hypothetical protein EOO01_06895 [Chitinophagaceae bacterium]|nr:MAG: hypothetical protein EOO01_06895 [Chitinophagaceae bacterium]